MPDFTKLEPGIYDGIPADVYHRLQVLSASGCKTLLDECPATFRYEQDHPEEDEGNAAQWIGSAAHIIALEPHRWAEAVVVIDADDFRKKDAQERRDAALADGRIPLLTKHADIVLAMGEALKAKLGDQLAGGNAESSYLWVAEPFGVTIKNRPDWRSADNSLIVDYKTTTSATKRAFQARITDNGHHIQAGLYTEGHTILTGRRPHWLWVVQETKPPYCVTLFEPAPSVLHVGLDKALTAIETYAECTRTGVWPDHAPDRVLIDLPGWELARYEEFKLDRADRKQRRPANDRAANLNAELRDRAIAFQAPHGTALGD